MQNLYKLLAAIAKEGRLLARDKEALLILFGMPVAFVLIMSLALRDSFHERAGIRFSMLIVDQDRGPVGKAITEGFLQNKHFAVELADTAPADAEVKEALRKGRYKFALLIPAKATPDARRRVQQQLGLAAAGKDGGGVDIRLWTDPSIRGDQRAVVLGALNRALQGIETGLLLEQFGELAKRMTTATAGMPGAPKLRTVRGRIPVFDEVGEEQAAGGATTAQAVPTSVQQNAPAWTLLAMFFLVIPIAGALIKERQQGSLLRLKSMPAPGWVIFAGKVVPYFVINQIQVVLILLEGMYLLPRLGGDALVIGNSPGGIALLSAAASLAAIGYGLLVASFSRTQEQASAFGAISVLILAAIGGIMVPKLIMPPLMQQLAVISPLAWGLDGFLDIFLRGAGAADVLPRALHLLAFAGACFVLAVVRFNREFRHN